VQVRRRASSGGPAPLCRLLSTVRSVRAVAGARTCQLRLPEPCWVPPPDDTGRSGFHFEDRCSDNRAVGPQKRTPGLPAATLGAARRLAGAGGEAAPRARARRCTCWPTAACWSSRATARTAAGTTRTSATPSAPPLRVRDQSPMPHVCTRGPRLQPAGAVSLGPRQALLLSLSRAAARQDGRQDLRRPLRPRLVASGAACAGCGTPMCLRKCSKRARASARARGQGPQLGAEKGTLRHGQAKLSCR